MKIIYKVILLSLGLLLPGMVNAAVKIIDDNFAIPYTVAQCIEAGYTFTEQNCQVLEGNTLENPCNYNPRYFKNCNCPAKYQYNVSNCPNPRVLSGKKCRENFTKCSCPPATELLLKRDYCLDFCDGKCIKKASCSSPFVPNPDFVQLENQSLQQPRCICPPEEKLEENQICVEKCVGPGGKQTCSKKLTCKNDEVANDKHDACIKKCNATRQMCQQDCKGVASAVGFTQECKKQGEFDVVCTPKNKCQDDQRCLDGRCASPCKDGFWSKTGYDFCSVCPAPKITNSDNTMCKCPAKFVYRCNETNEIAVGLNCDGKYEKCGCKPGYFWDITHCSKCPAGMVCSDNGQKKEKCISPMIPNQSQTGCQCPQTKTCSNCLEYHDSPCDKICKKCCPEEYKYECKGENFAKKQNKDTCGGLHAQCICKKGFFFNNGKCSPCLPGHICKNGIDAVMCEIPKVSNKKSTACICPKATECKLCGTYYEGDCNKVCKSCCDETYKFSCTGRQYAKTQSLDTCGGKYKECLCAPGFVWNGEVCEECSKGSLCRGGVESETKCPSPQEANKEHTECVCPDVQNCTACKQYMEGICSNACKECCDEKFKFDCKGEGDLLAIGKPCGEKYAKCLCKEGYYWSDEGKGCQPDNCEPGHFSSTGKVPCNKCPADTYAAGSGNLKCKPCLENQFSEPGSYKCESCDFGFSRNGDGFKHPIKPLCKFCNMHKGYVLYSDKSYSKIPNPNKTPIAIIVDSCSRYAISLQEKSVLAWSSEEGCEVENKKFINYMSAMEADKLGYDGKENTQKIMYASTRKCTFPAAQYCFRYFTDGTRVGQWYLPSAEQLYRVSADNTVKEALALVKKAQPLSDSYYWTSSEKSEDEVFVNNVTHADKKGSSLKTSFYPYTRCFINY